MASTKIRTKQKVSIVLMKIWRNWNPYTLLICMFIGTANMENHTMVPQKFSCKSTFGYVFKGIEIKIWSDVCTPISTETLFTIGRIRKHNCLSKYEWIKKMLYINTVEYYSVMKRKPCHMLQYKLRCHFANWNKPNTEGQIQHNMYPMLWFHRE